LLASLPDKERELALRGLTEAQSAHVLYDWDGFWARPNQLAPPGDWRYWLVLAGRGFGKTRVGAEQVRKWSKVHSRIHLVAPTAADARDVMVEGESGLLSCFPPIERPLYEPSKRRVLFQSGALAYTFSADEPERLRGPQCECSWLDEAASWRFPEAFDNLLFGLRLGDNPRCVITTTPKPIKLIKDLIANPHTVVTRASSYENRANLAPAFFDSIIRKYEGTRLGRQELLAEVLEDVPGALWNMAMIDATRVRLDQIPPLYRIVVAIDPAVTAEEDSDETGIVCAGVSHDQQVYVLGDESQRASPNTWARAALRLLLKWNGDRIIAETNNGGDLVEMNIRAVHPAVPYRAVRASRGKMVRAEPVAALYEQRRVHHAGAFPDMEDQMCGYVPGGELRHDDRMDALVWAITDLLIDPEEGQIIVANERVNISRY
jgi:predicted phage terminase large subunit-like protein